MLVALAIREIETWRDLLKILLVAPRTDLLYVDAEVQEVLRLRPMLEVTTRMGEVRHVDLLTDVDSDEYDVFWFSGHATNKGLLLSDGTLSPAELAPLIRRRFSLVFLNSCDSIETAQMLQDETEASVIATVVDVPDRLSFQTGALFARELARSGDISSAYYASRPGENRTYVYLAGVKKKCQPGITRRVLTNV